MNYYTQLVKIKHSNFFFAKYEYSDNLYKIFCATNDSSAVSLGKNLERVGTKSVIFVVNMRVKT